jgi:hypothetical protein
MIEIQDISNATIDDLVNLLLDEKAQPFEIYVPKSTQLFASSSEEIAIDYAMLAFAGQKLNEVSDEFSYYYVSPSDHDSVLFKIKAKDIRQLAEALLFISYGYNNEFEDEIYYWGEIDDFIEKVKNGEIIPICPDFIKDHQEYNMQADEEVCDE